MKNKILSFLFSAIILLSIAGCGSEGASPVSNPTESSTLSASELSAEISEAERIMELINNIGTVSLDSKEAIESARSQYDNSSEQVQSLVQNLDSLVEAEKKYSELVILEENKTKAKEIEESITSIGSVSLDSKDSIAAAREKYNAAPDEIKEIVSNYEDLTKAETTYQSLKENQSKKQTASKSTSDSSKKSSSKSSSSSSSGKKESSKSSSSSSSGKKERRKSNSSSSSSKKESNKSNSKTVYITKTGKRYHYNGNCNGGTYIKSTLSEAKARGLTPCKKCVG